MTQRNHPASELHPEMLSIHALNRFTPQNSAARCVMFGSQFSQRPVIEGSEPRINLTGVEEEFGKFTFSVRMPENGTVISKIVKFGPGVDGSYAGMSPETLVIYQSHETGMFGCFSIPYFCSHDPVFGFKYEIKDSFYRIAPGVDIPEGTIFADSPAVKGESHYTYSKNLNICYMSHANVGLDGFVISEDVLPFFKFRLYEKRVVEFGNNCFLLNLYGDDTRYQPLPNVGEYVKDNGLLAVIRRHDPLMAPALTSRKDVQRVDYHFDEPIFARPGVGRVVDINVVESTNVSRQLPDEMTEQVRRYSNGCMQFYREILRFYDTEVGKSKRAGKNGYVPLTEELHNLIVTAKGIVNSNNLDRRNSLNLTYKNKQIENWRVEVVVEYEMTLNRGNKVSCEHGGKGVICRIEKPENMPVDEDGNRADLITGPDSVPGRSNLGRCHSPYFAAAARDVRKSMLQAIGLDRNWKGVMSIEEVKAIAPDQISQALDLLLRYYNIVSPASYKEFTELLTPEERYEWLANIFNDKIYNFMQFEDDRSLDEMIEAIESQFHLVYGPVTYVSHGGVKVKTKNKIRIAPLPIMLLDKIADDWLATSSGKRNNFGILTARTRADKYNRPWKATAPRVVGETEGRIYAGYGGRLFIAELIDRNGNLSTQREMAANIFQSESPLCIPKLVSRQKIEFGNPRPLQILGQFMFCMGVQMKYTPEVSQTTRPVQTVPVDAVSTKPYTRTVKQGAFNG